MRSDPARLTAPLAAAVVLAAGCAGLGPSDPGPVPESRSGPTERALKVAIAVEEMPAEDAWRVWYSLGAPARGVELLGGGPPYRHERWGVAVARGEASWEVEGGRERLCFSRPTQSFSASFRTWAEAPPEDRPLNVAASDGGRLLSTGHLLARPLASCDEDAAAPPAGDPTFQFSFRTTAERTIRLPGGAAAGELRWAPAAGGTRAAATYVYFGEIEPVEAEAATVLLDPGLPAWMRTEMASFAPRVVERFAAKTATPLPVRPLLVVTWGGSGGTGATVSTDTLPGLFVASVAGPGWAETTPEARREWFGELARGLFHLGDGGLHPVDEGSGWLPAAAAEHFATAAAVAFGVEAEAATGRRLIAQANDCLVRLAGRSLPAAAAVDDAAWSSCGAVAMAAADGALRQGTPPRGLADLFRRLFEHAAATGSYGTPAFFGGLQELGAEPRAVTDLRRLIRGPGSQQGDRFLQTLLAHAGVTADLVPPEDAAADPETLREMVARAIGRCYCGTGEAASCEAAATGREVASVAGRSLSGDPLAAWALLRSAVARGAALPILLGGEEVTLFCPPETFDPTWESLLEPAEPQTPG
jgi:hypothetical protein